MNSCLNSNLNSFEYIWIHVFFNFFANILINYILIQDNSGFVLSIIYISYGVLKYFELNRLHILLTALSETACYPFASNNWSICLSIFLLQIVILNESVGWQFSSLVCHLQDLRDKNTSFNQITDKLLNSRMV